MDTYSGPIFDAHIHTEFVGAASLQRFRDVQSSFNILGALTDSIEPASSNQQLRDLGVDRCAVISRTDWGLEHLETGLASGTYLAIKINLGFMHAYADDVSLRPLYSLARQYDVPILFHTGDTGSQKSKLKYSQPLALDEVITDCSDVKFMLVHSGNPWFIDAALLAAKNDNVWLELSSLVEGALGDVSRKTLFRLVVDPIRWMFEYTGKPEKFIFGSGWPCVDYPRYFSLCVAAIEQRHHRQVFFENAIRLFYKR